MTDDKAPAKEPLEQSTAAPTIKESLTVADPHTDFGNDALDGAAMPEGRFRNAGISDKIAGIIQPKTPVKITARPNVTPKGTPAFDRQGCPPGYKIENGLVILEKSLAERVRDQIRFPVLTKSKSIITGIVLLVFTMGAYIIYSELPTRPELVIGILMVTVASNVLVSSR